MNHRHALSQCKYSSRSSRRLIHHIECEIIPFKVGGLSPLADASLKAHVATNGSSRGMTRLISTVTSFAINGDFLREVPIVRRFRVRAFCLNGFQELDIFCAGDREPVHEKRLNNDVTMAK
jgi:hypothetical protein